jgi:hypothetical protein
LILYTLALSSHNIGAPDLFCSLVQELSILLHSGDNDILPQTVEENPVLTGEYFDFHGAFFGLISYHEFQPLQNHAL